MKKTVINFRKMLVPVIVLGALIISCNNNNDSFEPSPPTKVGDASDTTIGHGETMSADQTHVATMDSPGMNTMATPDTLARIGRDTGTMSKTGAKAKKYRISIVPGDSKAKSTAMEMDKEGFYSNTEVLPAFPGGQKALERFFEDNLVYPDAATDNSAEGTVRLTFAVDENGKVYNPVVAGTPIGSGIEQEAIRVFKKMPAWTPGRIKGKNVKTRYTLPVRFQLD